MTARRFGVVLGALLGSSAGFQVVAGFGAARVWQIAWLLLTVATAGAGAWLATTVDPRRKPSKKWLWMQVHFRLQPGQPRWRRCD